MSWLSKAVDSVAPAINDVFGGLIGAGKKPGTPNPFGLPDLTSLQDNTAFDFLKDLPKKATSVNRNESVFNDLLRNIDRPNSVQDVQNKLDTDRMRQLLEGVGIDERQSAGTIKSDFADRGLGGPGQISDIEANALAQNSSDANRTRAAARTEFANSELGRLKDKETAARDAYAARYNANNQFSTADANTQNELLKTGNVGYADITADRSKLLANLLADLYKGGEKNRIDTEQPGYLDSILRNVKIDIGKK